MLKTGLAIFDYYLFLPQRGLPTKRLYEFYGLPSSGKSSLVYYLLGKAQEANWSTLLIDTEYSLDDTYARQLGLDISKLQMIQNDGQPLTLEYILAALQQFIVSTSTNGIAVLDSIASAYTSNDYKMGQEALKSYKANKIVTLTMGIADKARILSRVLPLLKDILARSNSLIIFTNQMRTILDTSGAQVVLDSSGGYGLKHYACARIAFTIDNSMRSRLNYNGSIIKLKVIKSRISPALREAYLFISANKGLDYISTNIYFAKHAGALPKNASYTPENAQLALEKLSVMSDEDILQNVMGAQ